MRAMTDPATGLDFHEVGHRRRHGVPTTPGDADARLRRNVEHGEHGAIVLVPKGTWALVDPSGPDAAEPKIQEFDRDAIFTDWPHKASDSLAYGGESPCLSKAAAQWFAASKVTLIAVDTPQIDLLLAPALAEPRGGLLMNLPAGNDRRETGPGPRDGPPECNIAQRTLLGAGMWGTENVVGDLDKASGRRCTVLAFPCRWSPWPPRSPSSPAHRAPSGAAWPSFSRRWAVSSASLPARRTRSARSKASPAWRSTSLRRHRFSASGRSCLSTASIRRADG